MSFVLRLALAACILLLAAAGCRSKTSEPVPATAGAAAPGPVSAAVPAGVGTAARAVSYSSARPAVLGELGPDDRANPAATGQPQPELVLAIAERGSSAAWVTESGGKSQVFHAGRAGPRYQAVGTVVLSSDGKRCAYPAQRDGAWRIVVDGAEGAPFEAIESPVFSPDGAHLAYQARRGDRWYLVVDAAMNEGSTTPYPFTAFDASSSRIVYVQEADGSERGKLLVSDAVLKRPQLVHPHAGNVRIDGTRVAAVAEEEGRSRVISFGLDRPGELRRSAAYDAVFQVACSPGCAAIAFGAEEEGALRVVLDGREEPLGAGEQFVTPIVVRPDGKAVAAGVLAGSSVRFRQFFAGAPPASTEYGGIEGIVYSADGNSVAFVARDRDDRSFVVVDGKSGPTFDRIVTPVFGAEGKRLAYRARQTGRRFVVVADREGKTIRQHPGYDQVFPLQLTADGRSVAYGVKDGRQIAWKVEPL